MAWLWGSRGRSNTRPRVARAVAAARAAHTGALAGDQWRQAPGSAGGLGSAVAALDQVSWATGSAGQAAAGAPLAAASAARPARREDFGEVGALLQRAEAAAQATGRSRAEMWEEALRAWLEAQGDAPVAEPAPRPWLFEARRQRIWGEIEQTLNELRTA